MNRVLGVVNALLIVAIGFVGPFACAGTWRYWPGIAFLCALTIGLLANQAYVARRNKELLARRQRVGEGTPTWDLVWNSVFWPLQFSSGIVAGLGARLGWPVLPMACWPVGLAIVWSGVALSAWAMGSNRHFEGTVRIQREVGHEVVDRGPYARVRHPGYLGLSLWALGAPLMLLSLPAIAAGLVAVGWIVLRTALEDRFLRRELEGYSDYTTRVRARLVPGVW